MAAKLAEGIERGRCTGPQDIKFGIAESGNMQIGMLMEVTSGERRGLRARYYGNVEGSPAAVEITAKALMACGWDGKSWTELSGITRNCVQLVFKDDGGGRIKLAYINPDTAISFKQEVSKEEAAKRLEKLAGKANGSHAFVPPADEDDTADFYDAPV